MRDRRRRAGNCYVLRGIRADAYAVEAVLEALRIEGEVLV
jgi:hypothetical protein